MDPELTFPLAINLLVFLAGAFVGHRLHLWLDRRKDFITAAEPLRTRLLDDRRLFGRGYIGDVAMPTALFDALHWRLPWWNRRSFERAVEKYEQCKCDCDMQNRVAVIDKLLTFTGYR